MKKFIIAMALLAFSTTATLAERGDAGEGNGGGNGTPSPKLVTIDDTRTETYDYSCPVEVWMPASMSCGPRDENDEKKFDDFTRPCTYVPSGPRTIDRTCQGTREVVVSSRTEWQCPSPYIYSEYRDKHEVTRTCRLRDSDHGNVGNR